MSHLTREAVPQPRSVPWLNGVHDDAPPLRAVLAQHPAATRQKALQQALQQAVRHPALHGLTVRQLAVLAACQAAGGTATVGSLAAGLAIPKPGVSIACTSLAAAGLIDRRADPSDDRRAFLAVTPRGVAALDSIAAAF